MMKRFIFIIVIMALVGLLIGCDEYHDIENPLINDNGIVESENKIGVEEITIIDN